MKGLSLAPLFFACVSISCILSGPSGLAAQGVQPYPKAITDRLVHTKTAMTVPQVNVPFTDPDFGSRMVRVTDENSQFRRPGGYLRTEASGSANMWSSDGSKFYVIAEGGIHSCLQLRSVNDEYRKPRRRNSRERSHRSLASGRLIQLYRS